MYLDETWFDTHDVVEYGWVDSTSNCKVNILAANELLYLLHAGSDKGFIPNVKHSSAVIIMDNAPYHSRLHTKVPNSSTKKDSMLQFMEINNMEIPQNATKSVWHSKKELLRI